MRYLSSISAYNILLNGSAYELSRDSEDSPLSSILPDEFYGENGDILEKYKDFDESKLMFTINDLSDKSYCIMISLKDCLDNYEKYSDIVGIEKVEDTIRCFLYTEPKLRIFNIMLSKQYTEYRIENLKDIIVKSFRFENHDELDYPMETFLKSCYDGWSNICSCFSGRYFIADENRYLNNTVFVEVDEDYRTIICETDLVDLICISKLHDTCPFMTFGYAELKEGIYKHDGKLFVSDEETNLFTEVVEYTEKDNTADIIVRFVDDYVLYERVYHFDRDELKKLNKLITQLTISNETKEFYEVY